MKRKFLLGILIALIIVLVFTGCQRITEEDVSKEGRRWWVIFYKILEDVEPMDVENSTIDEIEKSTANRITEALIEIDKTLKEEFYPDKGEDYDYLSSVSLKDKYRYAKRRNELMEEALVKFKGEKDLKEIEGIGSLDDVPELWEKVNKQHSKGGGDLDG